MKVDVYRATNGTLTFGPDGDRVATVDVPDGSAVVPASRTIRESMLAVPIPEDPMVVHSWLARAVILAAVDGDPRFRIVDVAEVVSPFLLDVERN